MTSAETHAYTQLLRQRLHRHPGFVGSSSHSAQLTVNGETVQRRPYALNQHSLIIRLDKLEYTFQWTDYAATENLLRHTSLFESPRLGPAPTMSFESRPGNVPTINSDLHPHLEHPQWNLVQELHWQQNKRLRKWHFQKTDGKTIHIEDAAEKDAGEVNISDDDATEVDTPEDGTATPTKA
ncbi:hypothetical protein MMC07_002905 [Pseudocyphellaria aurata]|nr:hypothetical protein [Pseudocyphellaria aurata]